MDSFKQCKRGIALFAATILTLAVGGGTVSAKPAVSLKATKVTVKVDGSVLTSSAKTAPRKVGSAVLVPAKQLASKLSAKYSKKAKKVTLKKGKSKVVFTVGKKSATLNGKRFALKAKTTLSARMPMIDAARAATKLGYKTATYNSESKTLYISHSKLTGSLIINEVCSTNTTGFVDENNKHSDWIELYNGTYEDIDINGYYMTDKIEKPTKAKVAAPNPVIKSGEYMILVCSGNSLVVSTKYAHLNFRISKEGGETVFLIKPDGKTVVDKIEIPALETNSSYGRSPNLSNTLAKFTQPTPGSPN